MQSEECKVSDGSAHFSLCTEPSCRSLAKVNKSAHNPPRLGEFSATACCLGYWPANDDDWRGPCGQRSRPNCPVSALRVAIMSVRNQCMKSGGSTFLMILWHCGSSRVPTLMFVQR